MLYPGMTCECLDGVVRLLWPTDAVGLQQEKLHFEDRQARAMAERRERERRDRDRDRRESQRRRGDTGRGDAWMREEPPGGRPRGYDERQQHDGRSDAVALPPAAVPPMTWQHSLSSPQAAVQKMTQNFRPVCVGC